MRNCDWEQRKLGELLTEVKRPIKMKDDESYELVTVKRRNEGIVSRGIFKGKDVLVNSQFQIKTGDYLISKRQVVHGANGIVPNHLNNAIVSNEYLVSIGNKNITTDFLSIISRLPSMYRKFFLSSYGIDIEKLVFNVEDWKKRTIQVPGISEQNQITTFFNQLDNTIALHQRKLNLMKRLKQAYLQKMFPQNGESFPKVRFTGFSEPWEDLKVSLLAKETYGGGTPKTGTKKYWEGSFPWIQSSDLTINQLHNVQPTKFITEEAINQSATHKVPGNSIAIVTRVGVGKLALMRHAYSTSQDFLSLSDLTVDPIFCVYSLYHLLQREVNNIQGTSIKGITKSDLLEKYVSVPTAIEEQNKIGNFLKQFDDAIDLHQCKIEKLSETKKVLLAKMFL